MKSCFLLAALVLGGDGPVNKAAKAELAKFDGTWQMVSAESDGKKAPEEIVKTVRVVIKDGKHTVHVGDKVAAKDISFAIDATKTPKEVTDDIPGGKQIKGIYKLEGDTLTSCVAKPDADRPKEFSGAEGSGQTLRVFKRVKE